MLAPIVPSRKPCSLDTQPETLCAGFCAVGLIEGSSQTMRKLDGILIRPKVDIEKVRRIIEHVTVQRGDFNALFTQRPKDQRDFFGNQGKVTRNGRIAILGWLKVNGSGNAHRWRDHQIPIRNGFRTGNAVLVDAVIGLAMIAHNGIELCGVKIKRARWTLGWSR